MFTKTKKMKNILAVLLIILSLNSFAQNKAPEWHTDVDKAINLSIESGKPVFFFFTGSDWCGWCKKLVKEVFITKEFQTWANNNLILVELDFNRAFRKKSKLVQQKKATFNKTESKMMELSQQFGVRGYPTGWFVSIQKGENNQLQFNALGSQGYVRGGSAAWISGAERFLQKK